MLQTLRIRDFAIIAELELSLAGGFVVFTGETGAGKSIIVDAVQLVLGGRADAAAVREGADIALVGGAFVLQGPSGRSAEALLEREGLRDEPGRVVLAREVRREGRSTARVNGRAGSLALLRDVGGLWVDVHGQSEHLSLLRVREHLALLDRYAEDESQRQAFAAEFRLLVKVRQELEMLRQGERDAARRAEMLAFAIQEIEAAKVRPGGGAAAGGDGAGRPGGARCRRAGEARPFAGESGRRAAGGRRANGRGRPPVAPLSRLAGIQPSSARASGAANRRPARSGAHVRGRRRSGAGLSRSRPPGAPVDRTRRRADRGARGRRGGAPRAPRAAWRRTFPGASGGSRGVGPGHRVRAEGPAHGAGAV